MKKAMKFIPLIIEHQRSPQEKQGVCSLPQQAKENNYWPMN
jgi:hypothetical protein